YLTNLSIGCSPSVCNRIIVFVIATSSNVSGSILRIALRATRDDIWKASNISPLESISNISFDVKSNTSGWKYLSYVARKEPCHSILLSSNSKSIASLIRPNAEIERNDTPPFSWYFNTVYTVGLDYIIFFLKEALHFH